MTQARFRPTLEDAEKVAILAETLRAFAPDMTDDAQTTAVAENILASLHSRGLTLYKRKVNVHRPRRTRSREVTDEVRAAIILDFTTTQMNQHEIAVKHGVNIGRVNEIVHALEPAAA